MYGFSGKNPIFSPRTRAGQPPPPTRSRCPPWEQDNEIEPVRAFLMVVALPGPGWARENRGGRCPRGAGTEKPMPWTAYIALRKKPQAAKAFLGSSRGCSDNEVRGHAKLSSGTFFEVSRKG